tara:strand:+ start:1068 stop:1271 length:204 start_codon:yes stop_codon:yes gene_type:complete
MDINKIIGIIRNLKEDAMAAAPTNSVGGGNIAGLPPDQPPVYKKKKRPPILARGKMPGARKRWREGL